MKKLDNRGFAISTLIYSILIMAILIMGLLYSTIVFRKKATSDFTHNVEEDLVNREVFSYTVCTGAKELHKVGGVTIGSIPEKDTLKPGDAFDCNVEVVNNYVETGQYRFYYLSKEDGNDSSQNVVLIYFQNFPRNSNSTIAYDIDNEDPTKVVPTGLIQQLPTVNNWSNSLLLVPGGEEHKGTINGREFEYKNHAGYPVAVRAPRFSEIRSAVLNTEGASFNASTDSEKGITYKITNSKLSFLKEKTSGLETGAAKGYWLETVSSTESNKAWAYDGEYKGIYTSIANDNITEANKFAVRPVIVVDINNLYWD